MIKQRRHPWPGPEKTALDRSRTIARSLLTALQKVDPAAAGRHVDLAQRFGELWLAPTLDTSGGERRLTTEEAAVLIGRSPATVRQWISRGTAHGQLTRYPDGIDEIELLDLAAAMKTPTPEGRHP